MTEELFRTDSYLKDCTAIVVSAGPEGIVLDRTIFYPTGGGQPGDSGTLTLADGRAIRISDTRKGEKLVLVTDHAAAEVAPLAEWARSNGAPELIVPKKIVKVAEVPVLGSGKTDYVAIQKMVEAEKAA